MKDYLNLRNKVILVSGGYGHLGSAICKDLISLGASVYCLGKSRSKFISVFSDLIKSGNNIYFMKTNVISEKSVKLSVKNILLKEKKIDVLINNAINSKFRGFDSNIALKDWSDNLKNVIQGYFLLSKYCAEVMKKQRSGKIINISSLFGMLAPNKKMHLNLKNEPPISMVVGKGGINQLTKYLASLLGPYNVNVNSVSPGWFPKKKKGAKERKDYIRQLTSRIPLNRIGMPQEVTGVVSLLSSDKSSYITGQNFIIDGGYSIW
jgi:NAD(P)-dependent dehydrogenase (short-subunit alcohol dehydrogenase family)